MELAATLGPIAQNFGFKLLVQNVRRTQNRPPVTTGIHAAPTGSVDERPARPVKAVKDKTDAAVQIAGKDDPRQIDVPDDDSHDQEAEDDYPTDQDDGFDFGM